ncbi:MAG: gamma-glutamyl-gamma-aminobutyrate hydrolase [Rhodobacterales bacterium]|nr:MAG: gamma-glutamyl-gamma-aminobutyrate hydrolase [Rhodobacterales bacterium]
MARPVIGIIGNSGLLGDDYPVQATGVMNCEAVAQAAHAMPLVIPADPHFVTVPELLATCDGFLLTGGRPNVHPAEYGEDATEAHGEFDRCRDAVTLPLVRACVERGQPIFGVCRGFQEMNVALGGSLYPEIRELPGRMNHRMPPAGTQEQKFALRHRVHFTEGGVFHRLLGAAEVMTNSLHGQGVKDAGARVIIDGRADDSTPEALYVEGAAGFACGVQWHPEFHAASDPVSLPLFEALGAAALAFKAGECRPL